MVKTLALVLCLALVLPAGVDFDTVDDVLSCGSAADIDNMTPMTITWRMRLDGNGESLTLGGIILVKGNVAYSDFTALRQRGSADDLNFIVNGTSGEISQAWSISTSTVPKTYVLVWDGGIANDSVRLWENGVQKAQGAYGGSTIGTQDDAAGNLCIGNRDSDTARTFNGVLSCVAIWKAVASANDIAILGAGGGCRQAVRQTSMGTPLRFWPMDDGVHGVAVTTSVMDESGNAGHCTPSNNPAFEAIQVGY
ncbi:MAG TPA: LamG-like jellyroll fold domain-containing protein [Armatimonadota bacterium]|nr:LamG-like jellyroll fold domain-containing protein [Armatimonadota bacterium]